MERIFISYSRVDRSTVDKLAELLRQTYDHVWYDKSLTGGQDWWKEILKQIADCDHFIYLISQEALDSEYCQKEFEYAEKLGKHIVPVLVRARTSIPDNLQALHYVDMSKGIEHEGLNQLYAALLRSRSSSTASDEKREADELLLKNLIGYLQNNDIARIVQQTEYGHVNYMLFTRMQELLQARDLTTNPENQLFDDLLETAFSAFDQSLDHYLRILQMAFKAQLSNNELTARYKLLASDRGVEKQERLHDEAVNAAYGMQEEYGKLIHTIKQVFPRFFASRTNAGLEQSDLIFLEKVWPSISSKKIHSIDTATQNGYIDSDLYGASIVKYRLLRNQEQWPENYFQNSILEAAFRDFDRAVENYMDKIGVTYTTEEDDSTGRRTLVAHKYSMRRGSGYTSEDIKRTEQQYEEAVDAVLELKQQHAQLVRVVKTVYPEFQFEAGQNDDF